MFRQPHHTPHFLITVQPQITSWPTDFILPAQRANRLLSRPRSQHELHSLIHDTLSSPRHRQLLLALQITRSTVKDVMITICKGCHDNEHTEGRPYRIRTLPGAYHALS